MTDDYIAWATTWSPKPASDRAPLRVATGIYDEVDDRLGDDATGDDFLTRVLWLEMSIRLARVGWTIADVENARWPMQSASGLASVLRRA